MIDYKENGVRLMKLRGITPIREVAKAVGVSPGAYCMYESGKRNPRDEVKIRIANYFGVPVGDIFILEKFTHSKQ